MMSHYSLWENMVFLLETFSLGTEVVAALIHACSVDTLQCQHEKRSLSALFHGSFCFQLFKLFSSVEFYNFSFIFFYASHISLTHVSFFLFDFRSHQIIINEHLAFT